MAEIDHRQFQPEFGRDHLHRPAFDGDKMGAQGFVAADDLVEGAALQHTDVEGEVQVERVVDVVERVGRLQLVEEPEPLLGIGGRRGG